MNILAIECSAGPVSAAVVSDKKVISSSFSDNMLLYEDVSGITAVSLTTFRQYNLAFDGALKEVAFGQEHEYVWVLSGDDEGKSSVHIFLYDGRLIASAPYTGGGNLRTERLVEQ